MKTDYLIPPIDPTDIPAIDAPQPRRAHTSIEMIARAAGASIGVVYLRFLSKEDVYVSLLEAPVEEIRAAIAQLNHLPAPERLRACWRALTSWLDRSPEDANVLRMLGQASAKLRLSIRIGEISSALSDVRQALVECVEDGIKQGACHADDPHGVVDLAWSSLLGDLSVAQEDVTFGRCTTPGEISPRAERTLRLIEDMLTRMRPPT